MTHPLFRAVALATLVSVLPQEAAVQDGRSVLQIKVVLMDGERKPMPVPRHVLLVSDDPPTAPPRRIQTAIDGTASVRLGPGNYTVESDQPVAFQGKAYQWMEILKIAPGRDAVLELTAENAEVAAVTPASAGSSTSLEADPSSLLMRWQDSVVALWSPTASASGFVVDARGLILTNQRSIGPASSVEVQLTPAIKLAARVLLADPVRDVAVLWIDPKMAASVPPVPLGCARSGTPPVKDGQEIVAIGAPLRRSKSTTSGTVRGIEGRVMVADFVLGTGGAGGPVFAGDGRLVGISSLVDETGNRRGGDSRVVRIEEVCASVASAELTMKDAAVPDATHLPLDPERPFPIDALKDAAERNTLSLNAYRVSSSSYDVTFITPVIMYAARNPPQQGKERGRRGGGIPDPRTIDPLDDFNNWSAYVGDFPPVLMIRMTPKLVEGFWTKFARGAAQTQGVSLPPIKRFKPGFARLQAFCGDAEVTPIHPFKLEQRVSESDAIYEGLYVFDPGALGPSCGSVRLVLYSEKEPQKGETRLVDPNVLKQIWEDFAPYRALK
jgi:S1-C subfamily serine protease